jgi:hypothetical protein
VLAADGSPSGLGFGREERAKGERRRGNTVRDEWWTACESCLRAVENPPCYALASVPRDTDDAFRQLDNTAFR